MWNEDSEEKMVADMLSYLDAPPVRELLASTLGNPTPEQLVQVCTDYRTNPSYLLLGYQRKGVIIGCIGLQLPFPGSAIIRAIAVAPSAHGQGIGSRLLRQSIKTFTLSHLVAETDRDAVEFYRRCGFTISSLGEKYPGTERIALLMDGVAVSCPLLQLLSSAASGDGILRTGTLPGYHTP